jgi:hypothetical protein
MKEKKEILFAHLKKNRVFWNIQVNDDLIKEDDLIIEKTLRHLEVEDINLLFEIYPNKQIYRVWKETLLCNPKMESLNLFLALYYFNFSREDANVIIQKHKQYEGISS